MNFGVNPSFWTEEANGCSLLPQRPGLPPSAQGAKPVVGCLGLVSPGAALPTEGGTGWAVGKVECWKECSWKLQCDVWSGGFCINPLDCRH